MPGVAEGVNSAGFRRAIQQTERTDYSVDIIVLSTDDFWSMALTKSDFGEYLFGDPSAANIPRL